MKSSRRASRSSALATILCAVTATPLAAAAPAVSPESDGLEPAVDVSIHEAEPARRIVALEWNPLPAIAFGTLSANVIVVPVEHHALVLNPFYASTETAPVYVYDAGGKPSQLPKQRFRGAGGELGYRYYFGRGGPRGFFLGPSLMLAPFKARAENGTETPYLYYGASVDVGYEALVADNVAIGLGAGVGLVETSKPIPHQQFPAEIYAERGVLPRVLLSIGGAL